MTVIATVLAVATSGKVRAGLVPRAITVAVVAYSGFESKPTAVVVTTATRTRPTGIQARRRSARQYSRNSMIRSSLRRNAMRERSTSRHGYQGRRQPRNHTEVDGRRSRAIRRKPVGECDVVDQREDAPL